MDLNLFGFRIGVTKNDQEAKAAERIPTFTPPPNEDGAIEFAAGGAYGASIDMEGTVKSESALITKYREMALTPECDYAVDDIINEAIVTDDRASPCEISTDELEQPSAIKNKIRAEFEEVLGLLDFRNLAYDIFRRWYVDGRLYFHIMIDVNNPRAGIKELRYIDPRKIRKVREPRRKTPGQQVQGQSTAAQIQPAFNEYFLFNPNGLASGTGTQGIKIAKDSICYVHSGILDQKNKLILSHLQKALKPLNQLTMLEDSSVIYRLARAPERRIFYIDVGNLPKMKAEQYVRDMMTKHKNKLVYDVATGAVRDDRKFMTMLEDYWLPRREGGKGTEIETLPGGENLGEMTDVEYFRRKLYKALNVPVSRMESDASFNVGRSSEISRDEIKFSKFVDRIRSRFNQLFNDLLEIQLVLKGVMTREEWKTIRKEIQYDYHKDNHYTEMKEQEIMNSRLAILQQVDLFLGKFYSREWVQKKVLRFTDEEIEELQAQMDKEKEENPEASGPTGAMQPGDDGQDQGDPPGMPGMAPGNPGQPPQKPKQAAKPLPKPKPAKMIPGQILGMQQRESRRISSTAKTVLSEDKEFLDSVHTTFGVELPPDDITTEEPNEVINSPDKE